VNSQILTAQPLPLPLNNAPASKSNVEQIQETLYNNNLIASIEGVVGWLLEYSLWNILADTLSSLDVCKASAFVIILAPKP
jgi:hypothetical protein